ncbi:MAG TPA: MarR family transcriptional regulator [Alphaproteobacteria bacterium]|nr:MarR family transcriptional regulator [Alphaproteobacteria bacterium]
MIGRRTGQGARAGLATAPGAEVRRTLGFLLQDSARLIRRRFIARAREADLPLNHSETSVLQHVAHDQGVTQAKLAAQLDIEPITLVRLLDRLEELGLIERRSHPNDRRSWTIWLTKVARPMLDRIEVIRLAVRAEALDGFSRAEQEALTDALVRLRANLASKTEV